MQEIFKDVRDTVKQVADFAWKVALAQNNPMDAAKFLDNVTNYYKNYYTDEEIEFLQFYFNSQMEMMKDERNDYTVGKIWER